MQDINFRHIATQIGDSLKYVTSVNQIDRIGLSLLKIQRENFPNDAITSVRAKALYDWVLSLAKTPLDNSERVKRLIDFCLELSPSEYKKQTIEFLEKNNCHYNLLHKDNLDEFLKRNFHSEVIKHSQKLFMQGNFFHAVFESAKLIIKMLKRRPKVIKMVNL